MKPLITCICLTFAFTLSAQDSQSYKSLNWSVGGHLQTPSSFGVYGTWETMDYKHFYADVSFTLERYPHYDNISYHTARNVYEDEELNEYPNAMALNFGYVFNDNADQIRPFIYCGINGGTRQVAFYDRYRILGTQGNYLVDLPNSGYAKLNIGGGIMIPLSDMGELKISADANPPGLHIGIGLVNWSKAKK
mgnify:FL=1